MPLTLKLSEQEQIVLTVKRPAKVTLTYTKHNRRITIASDAPRADVQIDRVPLEEKDKSPRG